MNFFNDEYELLFAACELVAKHKKIKLIKPTLLTEGIDLFTYIDKVAKIADVRVRKIALKPNWWKNDAGPLLAFYQENPCALIPRKMGGYLLVDIKNHRRIRVTEKISQQLLPDGFYFYSPLPANLRSLKDLLKFSVSKIKPELRLYLTAQIFISLLILVPPVLLGYLFNVVIPDVKLPLLWEIIAVLFITIFTMGLFRISQNNSLIRLRFKLTAYMEAALWDKILKLPMRFFRRFSSGDLLFRVETVSDIQNTLIEFYISVLANGLSLLLTLVILFYYSVALSIVTLVLAGIILLVLWMINVQQFRLMRRMYLHFGEFIGFVFEAITGIAKIRVTNSVVRIFQLWAERLTKRSAIEFKVKAQQLKLEIWLVTMSMFSLLLLYGFAGLLKTPLSFGDFVTFYAAYTIFFIIFFKLTVQLGEIIRIIPWWKKSRVLFSANVEHEAGQVDPGELNGDIVIDNVSFRYQAHEQPLFKNFSLSIRAGEFIAVVGPSGSGKSTLFRLILGFEEAEAGEIYFNGVNLKTLQLASVRQQIGVVIQNSTLIPGTIFANIAGNNATMSRVEAWDIAEKVGLKEFINALPMQMDTLITEGPITLSGGEAQRLIIARALAQKPKILVLDEATSALDNTTQAVVHRYLKQLQATQIIAAHRLSTIVNADRIVVMDKGAIVQSGTFTELMSAPGLFAQMAARQF